MLDHLPTEQAVATFHHLPSDVFAASNRSDLAIDRVGDVRLGESTLRHDRAGLASGDATRASRALGEGGGANQASQSGEQNDREWSHGGTYENPSLGAIKSKRLSHGPEQLKLEATRKPMMTDFQAWLMGGSLRPMREYYIGGLRLVNQIFADHGNVTAEPHHA
jgi:hypothetical protein